MPRSSAATHDADTEGRILAAARRVFVRRGTAGARMAEIAEEAGVNQALLHYYFRTKEALGERVFLEAAGRLVQAMAPALAAADSLEGLVESFVHGYIDAVRQTPFLPGYVLAETHHDPARAEALIHRATGHVPAAVAGAAIQRLGALIDAKVSAGQMRPVTPRQFLVHVAALVVFPFVARPVLLAGLRLDDTAWERFLDERRAELPGFILNALRP